MFLLPVEMYPLWNDDKAITREDRMDTATVARKASPIYSEPAEPQRERKARFSCQAPPAKRRMRAWDQGKCSLGHVGCLDLQLSKCK